MPTDPFVLIVGTMNHCHCIPSHIATDPLFKILITRIDRLISGRDSVYVGCLDQCREWNILYFCLFEQCTEDIIGPFKATLLNDGIKGFAPFAYSVGRV